MEAHLALVVVLGLCGSYRRLAAVHVHEHPCAAALSQGPSLRGGLRTHHLARGRRWGQGVSIKCRALERKVSSSAGRNIHVVAQP